MKISIIIEHKSNNLDNLWSYIVPLPLQKEVVIGKRVKVLFNKQIIIGFIVKIETIYDYNSTYQEILEVIDEESFISKRDLNLVKFLNFNFLNRKIDYLNLFVMNFVVAQKKIIYYPLNVNELNSAQKKEYDQHGYISQFDPNIGLKKDFIVQEKKTRTKKIIKRICSIRDFEIFFLNNHKNKQLQKLKLLLDDGSSITINSLMCSKNNLNKMLEQKIISCEEVQTFFDVNLPTKSTLNVKTNRLTKLQQEIVSNINLNKYQKYLIQGVTGSGKTHIFIELINEVNAKGKIAYVLIPEVSLSYKIFEKLSGYIKNTFLYHYKVSSSYKLNLYQKLKQGKVNLIVGTRSTLFLNNKNIGLIIFDEEHDEDYYQSNTPTYDSKVLANVIAQNDNFPIIYSSATPSLKTLVERDVVKFELNESFNSYVNTYEIVKHEVTKNFISKVLERSINLKLAKNEQSILLFNKKAYAQFLICNTCSTVDMCPNCNISRKVYVSEGKLRCNNCGSTKPIYNQCLKCGSHNLSYKGNGIEQVYHELSQIFDPSLIVTIDAQTLQNEKQRIDIMNKIEQNEVKIILGTQIIAKGFDFKNITLGAILDADNSLNLPFYNAAETTFALLNQFIGRVGRHKQGHIILQTHDVVNKLWTQILTSQFNDFATNELILRKKYKMVPFINELYFRVYHKNTTILFEQIKLVWTLLKQQQFQVSDIYAPRINKIGLNHFLELKIIFSSQEEKKVKQLILKIKKQNSRVKTIISVNPSDWR